MHKLDNESGGQYPSDPRNLCSDDNDDPSCLPQAALLDSVYCTCRCGVPSGVSTSNQELCSCPSGFECVEVLTQGGPGVIGSYCVKSSVADR